MKLNLNKQIVTDLTKQEMINADGGTGIMCTSVTTITRTIITMKEQ